MTTTTQRPPLARPHDVVLGGVCLALSRHLRCPVWIVRVFLAGLALAGGAGVLLYLWLWALVPLDSVPDAAAPVTRRVPAAAVLGAVAAVSVLGEIVVASAANDGAVNVTLATAMVSGSAAVAWSLTLDRTDPRRSVRYGRIVRFGSVGVLFAAGIIVLLSRPTAGNAVLGLAAILLGAAVLVAPRVVTLWTDLMAERAARVREEQRAEIAAHLHDSVLQTLALIQNRAGASSEVARIARAQERELRDWLFAADAPTRADLATELREIAAAVELDYAVRIDVVAAGSPVENVNAAIVGAAREAMLNAARHAGGEVSVYIETPPGAIDVYIRDRGPGVDLARLPDDRLGIRESIIGRMARAGGSATVSAGAGSGTEVHLHLETAHD
jgi:signal transduction histidine kinase